jgi:hypothetical protein
MRRSFLVGFAVLAAAAGWASAAVVVQRWGVAGCVQHPNTLKYEPAGVKGTLLSFDLSALPRRAKVYRARLFFFRDGGYDRGFEVVPAEVSRRGGEAEIKAADEPLALAAPTCRWFDATDAVRGWAKARARAGHVLVRRAPAYKAESTYLEIAYEGKLKDPPRQVTDVRAFYRAGQVFITFREIEDLSEGHDDYPWGHLIKKSGGYNVEMLRPKDDPREIRYRVYRHDKPITARNIGEAELLAEVVPGSRFNTRQVRMIWRGEQVPSVLDEQFVAVRLAVEHNKPLPSGVGKYVHTVPAAGTGYYAVVTAVNGVENTVDISGANTAGVIEQKVAPPEPVVYKEVVTELTGQKASYVQQWCNWYVGQPLSHIPICFDVVMGFCPQKLPKPAPLYIHRGHSWIHTPEPVGPSAAERIDLSHCSDSPNAFWMGINESHDTLKGIEEGRWQPFPQRRQEALIEWLDRKFGLDRQQVTVAVGAWGMMEFRKPEIYAYLHGWGLPEVTKGFQAWGRAKGVWGGTAPYLGRPKPENPFHVQDMSSYVLEDPARETPFFNMHMGWGAHFGEMGWPSLPRFYRAMMDTRRPFVVHWQVRGGLPTIRRDQSVPAFGNCSLDDMPGSGDPSHGDHFGARINAYLSWDSEGIVDEPARWEMTVRLDGSAPLPECTVDLTPRKCRKFRPAPGDKFTWTNTPAGASEPAASGDAAADKWGLVTLKQITLAKGNSRIVIQKR